MMARTPHHLFAVELRMPMPTPKDEPNGRCTICGHPERPRAELLLAGGAGLRAVARKLLLPYHSLRRHWVGHVSPERRSQLICGPLKPQELAQRAAEEGLSLLDYLRIVRNGLMARFLAASEADDRQGAALVSGRLIQCLSLTAQLTGEISRTTANVTNNVAILTSPLMSDLQSMLIRTLAPHPQARAAVLKGLEDLSRRAVPDAAPMLGLIGQRSADAA
jgi:hypothetical protein